MRKIEKLNNHLIIQIGDTYSLGDGDYKVLTSTSELIGEHSDSITMTIPVYHLQNIKTEEVVYVPRKSLEKILPKYNEVVRLGVEI